MKIFASLFLRAVLLLAMLTAVTGIAYPALVTLVAQTAFADRARGSLILDDGRPRGSTLIGQSFEEQRYFWGRLSATSARPYDAAASSGSNLGPTNASVRTNARARMDALKTADPEAADRVPVDLVTSSASGLDPHISPAAAEYQVSRVARARRQDPARVRELVREATTERELGVLAEPRVNVVLLNRALDRDQRAPAY